ncbi:MAG: hypothetical protein V3T58_05475 [Candidatus Hydrothermarchaeales archaeon]
MRIVKLCVDESCPVVELGDDYVRIGEEGNLCTLQLEEWSALKEKVLKGEL